MDLLKSAKEQLNNLQGKVVEIPGHELSLDDRAELNALLFQAGSLIERAESETELGGAANHPLGPAPFITTKLMYSLYRSEEILSRTSPKFKKVVSSTNNGQTLIYPDLTTTLLRRILRICINLRAWRTEWMTAEYDQPTLLELLYLKSPYRLLRVIGWILPEKRYGFPFFGLWESMLALWESMLALWASVEGWWALAIYRLRLLPVYYRAHPWTLWRLPFAVTKILLPECIKSKLRPLLRFKAVLQRQQR